MCYNNKELVKTWFLTIKPYKEKQTKQGGDNMPAQVKTMKNEKTVNTMPVYRNRVGVRLDGFGVGKRPSNAFGGVTNVMVNAWLLVGIAALVLLLKAI